MSPAKKAYTCVSTASERLGCDGPFSVALKGKVQSFFQNGAIILQAIGHDGIYSTDTLSPLKIIQLVDCF